VSPPLRDERCLRNDAPAHPPRATREAILAAGVVDTIRAERDALLRRIAEGLPPTASLERDVYAGAAGLALMWLHLAQAGVGEVMGRTPDAWCAEYLAGAFRAPPAQGVGFLCGELGPLAIATALAARTGAPEASLARHLPAVESMAAAALGPGVPDELLYGRAGLLYGLRFIECHGGPDLTPRVREVAQAALDSGRRSGRGAGPLRYTWQGHEYLGAAHGLAGITWMLLSLELPAAQDDLRRSVEALVERQLPSGNVPALAEQPGDDRLVHWCHGAPGMVALLAAAAERLREPRFLEAARRAADVTWERGLLRKGLGLCHGVGGNGYALLAMWRATSEAVYLHRAVQFALFCASEAGRALHGVPDAPLSLFEGLAGTVCFLTDVLRPEQACFPGYELRPGRAP
jgi:hypothetical protein